MNQEYILRLYDMDMLTFTLTEQDIEGLKAHILWTNAKKRHLLPLDMEPTRRCAEVAAKACDLQKSGLCV